MKRALLCLVLSAGLLAGCGDNDTATPAPAPAPGSPAPGAIGGGSPTSGPVETQAGPVFPANTAEDTEEATGAQLSVVAVRTARQAGYDRVVFELSGKAAGQPGWRVSYTDKPVQDGSGDPVTVAGSAYLQVILTGVGVPADTGIAPGDEVANERFTPTGTELIRQVVADSVFEGQFTAFIGLERKAAFRVFRLGNPTRVVVDVRHS